VDEAEALARLVRIGLRVLQRVIEPPGKELGAGHPTDPDTKNGDHDHDLLLED
jgi:hypothetical protein